MVDIKNLLIFVGVVTSLVLVLVSIQIQLMSRSKKLSKVQEMVILGDMREFYESKIDRLNEKLIANLERWKDANHLLVSENDSGVSLQNKSVYLSEFLVSHGITNDDIVVDVQSVFVLTPFLKSRQTVYRVINDTCNNAGLKCSRGDEQYVKGDVLPTLLKKIVQARLVIANIDGRNANVFYELGIAHALDKPTILITKRPNDVPFDVKSKYLIVYQDYNDLEEKLAVELTKIFTSSDLMKSPV